MAFRRVVMQPTFSLSTNPTTQEIRFAIQTTGWKTGQVWVNVYRNASAAAGLFDVRGASAIALSDDLANPTFWPSFGTISITGNTTGVFRPPVITNLPDYLRWTISGNTNGSNITLEVIAYLWDT